MNLSDYQTGDVTVENRRKHINFLRMLYTLFAIELLVALIWTSFAIAYYKDFGAGIVHWWEFAIVTGVLCLVLILVSFFIPAVRKTPINIAIYAIFTICFMHFISYVCLVDKSRLVYYALWLLFAIACGFAIYAWSISSYMDTMICIIIVFLSAFLVFLAFLVFSEVVFIGLLFVLLACVVFGFYMNYNVNKMVRTGFNEYAAEDPFTGAVRIWIESCLVVCRLAEMLINGCCKSKN